MGLIGMVVRDAEIGTGVDVPGIDPQCVYVPVPRVLVSLRIEVQVSELHPSLRVGRITLGGGLQRGRARLIEWGLRLGRGRSGSRRGCSRRRRDANRLLAADNPADQHAEE